MFCRRPVGVASSLCKMGQPRATPRSLAEEAGEAVRWGGGPAGGSLSCARQACELARFDPPGLQFSLR